MAFKHIVALVLFVLAASPVWAQERIRFGAKLGVTSSEIRETIDGQTFGGLGFRLGLNGGVFAVFPVRGALGAQTEANYFRKSYGFEGELRDENNLPAGRDPRYQYDYASTLVALRYQEALGSDGTDFYAFFGPRLDVLLGDRASFTTPGGDPESTELPGLLRNGEPNGLLFGAAAGFGVDLSGRGVPLLIELRYDADLTPVGDYEDGNAREREFRFRAFSLRVGVSL